MTRTLPLQTPVHATAVAYQNRALLLLGPSGAGKSSVALELMAYGATLVGDDRVVLTKTAHGIEVAPVATLSGKIEARGFGILPTSFTSDVMLHLIADLSRPAQGRLPDPQHLQIAGFDLPVFDIKDIPNPGPALWHLLKHPVLP